MTRADQYAGWVLMGVVAWSVVTVAGAWAMPSGPALSPYGSSPQAVSPASQENNREP